ncbi:MAG: hypothetical protein MUE90_14000 [Thermoanaerobaculales bacterium]|jgi:MFS family permease|nr:hypothetical protein [Thermoanaerobaculales bacterium]
MSTAAAHRAARVLVLGALVLPALLTIGEPANPQHLDTARAFLRGSLWIDEPTTGHDLGGGEGRFYAPFPPLPALLAAPAVLTPWPDTVFNVTVVLAAVAAVLLAGRLGDEWCGPAAGTWAAAALGLGSGLWTAAVIHDTYHSAHVLAVLAVTAALRLATARPPRPAIAGFAIGLAALARQATVLGTPALAALSAAAAPGARRRRAVTLVLAASCAAALYPALNWLRFGSPLTTGYDLVHHHPVLAEDLAAHGAFSPAFVARNLGVMLTAGPLRVAEPPWLVPDPRGMSVLLVSPWLLLALLPLARPDRPGARAAAAWCWLAAGLVAVPQLLYVNTGWLQFGYRFALDWLPFLLLAAALGVRGRSRWLSLPPLAAAILVNLWGVVAVLNWDRWSQLIG